ncbi:molecular chaperone TorD, partial [Klebsiella oxytoca]
MGSVASVMALPGDEVSGVGGLPDDIDLLRAQQYDLLAALLGRAPD